jgi:hypothetical protein
VTVHARRLARLCRERLAAQQELPVLNWQQPKRERVAGETPPKPVAETATEATRTAH